MFVMIRSIEQSMRAQDGAISISDRSLPTFCMNVLLYSIFTETCNSLGEINVKKCVEVSSKKNIAPLIKPSINRYSDT